MTTDVQEVTVLGTGVLGSQIAYQSAYCDYRVTAYDITEEALDAGGQRFRALASRYEREVAGASDGRAQDAVARIRCSSDLADAVRDADLVIEAAPEVLQVKRDLYQKLARVAPENAIFATNSSTFLPSDLAAYTGRPSRFLALHFANEIWIRSIAEIMGHPGTDPAVYQTVVEFARSIGMEPIELKKEQPGYVLNSLLVPFLLAAVELLVKDVADPEMIDKTWCIATGAPFGPFLMLDVIGLNTAYNIAAAAPDETVQAAAKYIRDRYLDQGKLGLASGEGFYKYRNPVTA